MKYLKTILITLSFLSCNSTKIGRILPQRVDECSGYRIKNPKQISFLKFRVEELNKEFNSIGFCTHNPDVMGEILFEDYGQWDTIIKDKKLKRSFTYWKDKNVRYIDNKLTFISFVFTDWFGGVIILDSDGNDLLANDSESKVYLQEYLANKVNTYDYITESKYHKLHWKAVNPKTYYLYNKE